MGLLSDAEDGPKEPQRAFKARSPPPQSAFTRPCTGGSDPRCTASNGADRTNTEQASGRPEKLPICSRASDGLEKASMRLARPPRLTLPLPSRASEVTAISDRQAPPPFGVLLRGVAGGSKCQEERDARAVPRSDASGRRVRSACGPWLSESGSKPPIAIPPTLPLPSLAMFRWCIATPRLPFPAERAPPLPRISDHFLGPPTHPASAPARKRPLPPSRGRR